MRPPIQAEAAPRQLVRRGVAGRLVEQRDGQRRLDVLDVGRGGGCRRLDVLLGGPRDDSHKNVLELRLLEREVARARRAQFSVCDIILEGREDLTHIFTVR